MDDAGRSRRLFARARWVLVLLPSLIAAAYYGLFAADQYVSQAQLVVRDGHDQAAAGGLAELAAQARAANAALAVRDYLLSRDAMQAMAPAEALRRVWAGRARDPLTALGPGASDEALFDRYRQRVAVVVNGSSGVVTLRVQTFAAADAQRLAARLLSLAGVAARRLSDPGELVVITLVNPDLPDRPAEPQRLRTIFTVLGFNLIAAAMAWLIGTGLREHGARDKEVFFL